MVKHLVDKYIINNKHFVKLVLSASVLNKQKKEFANLDLVHKVKGLKRHYTIKTE